MLHDLSDNVWDVNAGYELLLAVTFLALFNLYGKTRFNRGP